MRRGRRDERLRVVPLPGLPLPMGYLAAPYGDAGAVHLIEPELAGRPIPLSRLFPELEQGQRVHRMLLQSLGRRGAPR